MSLLDPPSLLGVLSFRGHAASDRPASPWAVGGGGGVWLSPDKPQGHQGSVPRGPHRSWGCCPPPPPPLFRRERSWVDSAC